mgnify:CR=1 FL=1
MAITWFAVLTKIERSADIKYILKKSSDKKKKMHSPAMPLMLLILTLAAIFFQGILRDGVTTWLPTEQRKINSYQCGHSDFLIHQPANLLQAL